MNKLLTIFAVLFAASDSHAADTTPPTLTLNGPANGSTLIGDPNFFVPYTATDDVGVTTVGATLDGNSIGIGPPLYYLNYGSNGVLVARNCALLPTYVQDGPHTLVVTAFDAAGNSTSATLNFVLAHPSVALNSPANGAVVSGTTPISATVTNPILATRIDLTENGNLLASFSPISALTYSWNTLSVADGYHSIVATLIDVNGVARASNTSTVIVYNTIDHSAPSVSITGPSANSTVGGTGFDIYYHATDNVAVTSVHVTADGWIDGGTMPTRSGDSHFNICLTGTTSLFPDRTWHTFYLTVYDIAGNASSAASVRVYVDRNASGGGANPTPTPTPKKGGGGKRH